MMKFPGSKPKLYMNTLFLSLSSLRVLALTRRFANAPSRFVKNKKLLTNATH
jgi:hypothetical protein